MAKLSKINIEKRLIEDITRLIEESRSYVAQTANATLTLLYWKIGGRINNEILDNRRAEYGKQIVATLSQQLTQLYGRGFNYSSLTRMIKFAEVFPDQEI